MRNTHYLFLGLCLALAASPVMAQSQRMAIPSYFGPGALWTKLEAAAPRVGLAIINPNSGPGDAIRADYVAQVKSTQAHGVIVLGYIHTSYGKRPLSEIKSEIATYRHWYGVNGIFLDEVTNEDAGLPYYLKCRDAIRAGHPKDFIVINPGTPVTESYMAAANVVLTFESDYGAYLKRAADPAWVANYPPKRFFHLIYAAPNAQAMRQAVALSKQRNAGWVYITPDTLPNPWDTLPEGAYWNGELAALGHH
jgi:hypothetical protein